MTKTGPATPAAFGNIYAGKKILLTGHTGFKGAWLAEWLLQLGAQVTGYSIDCPRPSLFDQLNLAQRMDDVRGDICDLGALTKLVCALQPDFIFHLAAQPLVRHSYVDPIGTFTTNVAGSINVMEAIRTASFPCAVVMVTTDKCYENREISHAYRESDPLGGHDPYSASKAAAEIAIDSYRKSFFAVDSPIRVALSSARAGNVIGGGDWADDRLLPDSIRSLQRRETIGVRNKDATRPWQHVLDPLSGYLTLGAALRQIIDAKTLRSAQANDICSAFNFGPNPESNRPVGSVVDEVLKHWPGEWIDRSDASAPHEAGLLNLNIEKAERLLQWHPLWDFQDAVARTVSWYRGVNERADPLTLTRTQIEQFQCDAAAQALPWAR